LTLATSLYKESMLYHGPCLESIANQTDNNFLLLIYTENIPVDISSYNIDSFCIIDSPTNATPMEIKELAIRKTSELGMKYLAFIDSDDTMEPHRVEVLNNIIRRDNPRTFIHNINIINSDGFKLASNALDVDSGMCSYKDLLDSNICGFGNSIYYLEDMRDLLPIPRGLISHDWYVSFQLACIHDIKIYNTSLINYRQHSNNVFSISETDSLELILKIFESKDKHYLQLQNRLLSNTFLCREEIRIDLTSVMKTWERLKEKIRKQDYAGVELPNLKEGEYKWNKLLITHM